MSDRTEVLEREGFVLEMSRTLNASIGRVFDAFASLEAMSKWFGPATCDVQGGVLEFRVGGQYRLDVQTEEYGNISVGGEYTEIDRPKRIAFTWQWQGHDELCKDIMNVVFAFEAQSETCTELRLTQTGFPDRENAEHHGIGWGGSFDKLKPCVEE